MRRWWESDRSKLAASVRSTRRRLRAGFRGSVAAAVEARARIIEADAKARCDEFQRRAVAAEDQAEVVSRFVHRAMAHAQSFNLERSLVVAVRVDERVFVTAPSLPGAMRELARAIGRQVERCVAEAKP